MAKAEKLFERMQRTPHGWGEGDFETLYRDYGFDSRTRGKHTIYTHPDYPDLIHAVGRHRDLAPHYAETAVSIITDLLRRQAQKRLQDVETRKNDPS